METPNAEKVQLYPLVDSIGVSFLPWGPTVELLFSTVGARVFGAPHSECYRGSGTARRVPARLQIVRSCKLAEITRAGETWLCALLPVESLPWKSQRASDV